MQTRQGRENINPKGIIQMNVLSAPPVKKEVTRKIAGAITTTASNHHLKM